MTGTVLDLLYAGRGVIVTFLIGPFVLLAVFYLLEKRRVFRLPRVGIQLTLLALTAGWIILVILAWPGPNGDFLQILGIALGAAIAFASTTFIGNGLAGLMLRVVHPFAIGDWLEAEPHFGAVLEHGLFHTMVQNVDLNLTTLPNLYLASHPFTVIPARARRGPTGKMQEPVTRVSAEVSLGYDVGHAQVEVLLSRAAENAGLRDPRVQVLHLGDSSVGYRVHGETEAIDALISVRSALREQMLDALHGADIEIASPTLLTTRAYGRDERFMAKPSVHSHRNESEEETPDLPDAVKARTLDERRASLEGDIQALSTQIKEADGGEKTRLEANLRQTEEELEELQDQLSGDAQDPAP